MRLVLLLLVCASTWSIAQVSRPTLFRPQIFDVQHYEADLRFPDPARRTIEGDVRIVVRWVDTASAPSFPVHLRGCTIDSVTVRDQRATVATMGAVQDDTMYHRVGIDHAVRPDLVDTIRVFYRGTMTNEGGTGAWGGVHYQDSVLYCLGVGFSANYVSTTQHWLACYDHPSDKATFRARFIVPSPGWNVASVGQRIATRPPTPDGYAVYDWHETHPTSTYLLTFAIGPYVTAEMDGVVPHVFYMLERDRVRSTRSYALVPRMTETFARRYGPYPFDKVGYCNTLKGAMEHQTMISFPVSLAQRGDTVNTTAAHELAHQWFGDCVSPVDFRYAWLTESFATFSECVWLEELRGRAIYFQSLESKARTYITGIARDEGVFPLEDFNRTPPSSNYPQTIYQKGAVVVAMARALAGDSAFFDAMQRYINVNRYGTATTAEMTTALRPALGERTDAFMREWVTGRGWAKLAVDLNLDDRTVTVTQMQRATNPDWPLFTTLPLNIVYGVRSGADLTIVDTVMLPDSEGVIRITCDTLIGINTGTRSRVLAEIVSTTHSFMERQQSSEASSYVLAPNPAADLVHLQRANDQAIVIRVVTARGGTVITRPCAEGRRECDIPTSGLASGTYTVEIERGGHVVARLPLVITRGE